MTMGSKKIKIESGDEAGKAAGAAEADRAPLARLASGTLSQAGFPLTVGGLERALLADFPASDAEEWDRTGLLVGDPSRTVRGVAVALDPTVSAVKAAAAVGANVLLTHHPAFLEPPTSFKPAPSVAVEPGACVWAAIDQGVALMNFHTALDVSARAQRMVPGLLSLAFERVLLPLSGSPEKGYGQVCGMAGAERLTLGQLAARCTSVFARAPRVWGDFSRELRTVVTCTGSVGGVARAALTAGADCVVCGEIKYHEALDLSQAGLAVIDLGHDTCELPFTRVLAQAVTDAGVPEGHVAVVDQSGNWAYPETTRV